MWEKIKNILQKQGGKCIIIEEDKPSYLVMKLDDYENNSNAETSSGEIEKVNRNIAEWKAEEQETIENDKLEIEEKVRIEDLPF
ncbi:MAG: hypothetical protein ABIC36_00800 [bacterium]